MPNQQVNNTTPNHQAHLVQVRLEGVDVLFHLLLGLGKVLGLCGSEGRANHGPLHCQETRPGHRQGTPSLGEGHRAVTAVGQPSRRAQSRAWPPTTANLRVVRLGLARGLLLPHRVSLGLLLQGLRLRLDRLDHLHSIFGQQGSQGVSVSMCLGEGGGADGAPTVGAVATMAVAPAGTIPY